MGVRLSLKMYRMGRGYEYEGEGGSGREREEWVIKGGDENMGNGKKIVRRNEDGGDGDKEK